VHIILASGSPRRKELLKNIFDKFDVIVPDIEEIVPSFINPQDGPVYLAKKKAEKIAEKWPESLVIGSDTGVFIDDMVLGKPEDEEHAVAMLKKLSGRKHKVITGCCVIYNNKKTCFSEETIVEFKYLTLTEIDEYIKTGEPFDKAGGYGIQGMASSFISSIIGDYNNVVGLPTIELEKMIKLSYNLLGK